MPNNRNVQNFVKEIIIIKRKWKLKYVSKIYTEF